jgi:hypothetical protein
VAARWDQWLGSGWEGGYCPVFYIPLVAGGYQERDLRTAVELANAHLAETLCATPQAMCAPNVHACI